MTKRPDKNLDPTKLVLNKSISNDTYNLIQVGNIEGGYGYVHHEQSNRVYSVEGLCPTLSTRYDDYLTGFKIIVKDGRK